MKVISHVFARHWVPLQAWRRRRNEDHGFDSDLVGAGFWLNKQGGVVESVGNFISLFDFSFWFCYFLDLVEFEQKIRR